MKTKTATLILGLTIIIGGCSTNRNDKAVFNLGSLKPITNACVCEPITRRLPQCRNPLPPPILWLAADAGVITDTSGRVTAWLDQSGFVNDFFQQQSISQPTCTGCGIHFDGLNQWLTHGTTISAIMGTTVAAHTTVIYVKPNLANPAVPQTTDFKNVPATIIGSQDTAASSGLGITNINNQAEPIYGFMREDFKTLDEIHGTAPITGGQHMIAVTDALNEVGHLDDDIVLYVDGSVVANSNPGQRTSSRTISCIGGGFKVGNDFNSAANLFAGDIYEIIVFPKVLKPDQISCLNNYFVNHWHCR